MDFTVLTELDHPITYAFPTAEQASLPEDPLSPLGEDAGVPSCIGTPASVILRLWQEWSLADSKSGADN